MNFFDEEIFHLECGPSDYDSYAGRVRSEEKLFNDEGYGDGRRTEDAYTSEEDGFGGGSGDGGGCEEG